MEASSEIALAGDEIAVALRFLRHFPEASTYGATLLRPSGETTFISADTVRATMQEGAI